MAGKDWNLITARYAINCASIYAKSAPKEHLNLASVVLHVKECLRKKGIDRTEEDVKSLLVNPEPHITESKNASSESAIECNSTKESLDPQKLRTHTADVPCSQVSEKRNSITTENPVAGSSAELDIRPESTETNQTKSGESIPLKKVIPDIFNEIKIDEIKKTPKMLVKRKRSISTSLTKTKAISNDRNCSVINNESKESLKTCSVKILVQAEVHKSEEIKQTLKSVTHSFKSGTKATENMDEGDKYLPQNQKPLSVQMPAKNEDVFSRLPEAEIIENENNDALDVFNDSNITSQTPKKLTMRTRRSLSSQKNTPISNNINSGDLINKSGKYNAPRTDSVENAPKEVKLTTSSITPSSESETNKTENTYNMTSKTPKKLTMKTRSLSNQQNTPIYSDRNSGDIDNKSGKNNSPRTDSVDNVSLEVKHTTSSIIPLSDCETNRTENTYNTTLKTPKKLTMRTRKSLSNQQNTPISSGRNSGDIDNKSRKNDSPTIDAVGNVSLEVEHTTSSITLSSDSKTYKTENEHNTASKTPKKMTMRTRRSFSNQQNTPISSDKNSGDIDNKSGENDSPRIDAVDNVSSELEYTTSSITPSSGSKTNKTENAPNTTSTTPKKLTIRTRRSLSNQKNTPISSEINSGDIDNKSGKNDSLKTESVENFSLEVKHTTSTITPSCGSNTQKSDKDGDLSKPSEEKILERKKHKQIQETVSCKTYNQHISYKPMQTRSSRKASFKNILDSVGLVKTESPLNGGIAKSVDLSHCTAQMEVETSIQTSSNPGNIGRSDIQSESEVQAATPSVFEPEEELETEVKGDPTNSKPEEEKEMEELETNVKKELKKSKGPPGPKRKAYLQERKRKYQKFKRQQMAAMKDEQELTPEGCSDESDKETQLPSPAKKESSQVTNTTEPAPPDSYTSEKVKEGNTPEESLMPPFKKIKLQVSTPQAPPPCSFSDVLPIFDGAESSETLDKSEPSHLPAVQDGGAASRETLDKSELSHLPAVQDTEVAEAICSAMQSVPSISATLTTEYTEAGTTSETDTIPSIQGLSGLCNPSPPLSPSMVFPETPRRPSETYSQSYEPTGVNGLEQVLERIPDKVVEQIVDKVTEKIVVNVTEKILDSVTEKIAENLYKRFMDGVEIMIEEKISQFGELQKCNVGASKSNSKNSY